SIRRNGFSIEKAPPVFQLLPLDPSAGRVGQEIVAPDGHHRTRSAGKAISQDGFIVVGGRKTQRLPVRVIGEAELREHEDGFHRPLTPWQLFLEFNTACQSFGREFRAVKHPALAAFYAAQTAKIVQVPFALVESGRDDYPLPHVGMTSSALPGGGVNQDGLLRFLDKSMALVVAVMDGLGGHVKSEDAVDIAGSTVVSSMQQKADLPLSVSEANRAVLDFHGQNGFKERRKKSEELFPPATTFTGARIYAEDRKLFAERVGVGDSYQFVIRHEKGHWIRRFDIERHFRVLDEDPKLELPPHLQDVLVSSTIGSVDMKVSHDVVELEEGDFVFLCSDGVLKNVQFFEISKLLDAAVREAADHNWSARQMLEKFSKNLHVLVEERQRAHIAYKKLKPDAQRKLEGSREARSELDDFTFATVIVLKDPVVDWNRLLDKGFSNVAAEPYSEKTTVETDKVEGSPVVSHAPGSLSLATGGFATGGFALRGMGSGLVGAMSQTPTPLRVLTTK
ncbi:MAG: protein phosphatase 2C family protein, partial [Deltaproteobacteria bacterium]|nr:protein phosphatase 2C family protein [Deltaproteobacteria bacterium]